MKKIFVSNVVKLLQEINNAESSLIWINQGESNIGLKLYQITRKQRWIIENKYEREEKSNIKHLNLPIYGYFIKKKKEKIPLVNIFYPKKSLNTIKTWRQRFSKSPANAMNYVP